MTLVVMTFISLVLSLSLSLSLRRREQYQPGSTDPGRNHKSESCEVTHIYDLLCAI